MRSAIMGDYSININDFKLDDKENGDDGERKARKFRRT